MKPTLLLLLTAALATAAPKPGLSTETRLWLQVPADSPPLAVTATPGSVNPGGWLPTPAENERLSYIAFPITTSEWAEATVTFTPQKDTTVTLSLLGPWDPKGVQKEVLYDDLTIEGATLLNPGFEEISGETFTS